MDIKKNKVVFVVLHYMPIEVTEKCIQSILNNISYDDIKIVVVDNGSPDGSGAILKRAYENNSYVDVILTGKNLGFSKGNNIGYKYAKGVIEADFIVIANNDTFFEQSDFIEKFEDIYNKEKYHVLGPDIINLCGVHQSPQRDHIVTWREVLLWYFKRIIFYCCLILVKRFSTNPLQSNLIEHYYNNEHKRISKFKWKQNMTDVELQGACFIFSPDFVEINEYAFEELTFMYGEEATLAWKCKRNQWKIMYSPEIRVNHAEKVATSKIWNDSFEKLIFYSKNHVIAIRMLLIYMAKNSIKRRQTAAGR